ncbi:MAG: DUF389 domain-containing protein [Actinomycetia bacterium]|nr:DUF389 domain-containing protein [Actinomycetes bacterium]
MAVTETQDDLPFSGPPTAPFLPITTKAWWHRHLDPEERRRVMDELAITRVDNWVWRFTVMLTLSVVVAVMGLSADSAAVVIGAMLLAPLMQPVLATAACLSMSLVRKALWALVKVVVATIWCIAIAYVLSRLIPDGPLPSEVESRTSPDIRDLVVGLAAGAAGSYATVRRDVSAALPGVAVAVALVPPLATVGITLEAGERDMAVGAMLLYATNLAAIIFAGVLVFIATGFVPPRRLANTGLQLIVAGAIALALVVVVAVPLFDRSAEAVEAVQDEVTARSIVDQWLNGANLSAEVDVDNERVLVELRGFDSPPDDAALIQDLQAALGDVTVLVEWVRTERATTTLPAQLTDDEALLLQVVPIVQNWLADNDDGSDYELGRVLLDEGVLRIDVAGAGAPPSVEDLVDRIQFDLEAELTVRVNWTERERITPGLSPTTPVQSIQEEMTVIVDEWASEAGLVVGSVSYNGTRAEVVVAGASEPTIYGLVADLEEAAGSEVVVDIFFIQRQLVTTTVPVVDFFPGMDLADPPSGADSTTPSATTTTTTG